MCTVQLQVDDDFMQALVTVWTTAKGWAILFLFYPVIIRVEYGNTGIVQQT